MKTDPLFSIVTVTRNNVRGLAATCGSVLSQTDKNYEWLIVDGASTDNTLLFLSKAGLLDHCVSEPDKGIYDAMNKGIERAQGRYILFLNAGDCFAAENTLDLISTALAGQGYDFIYGDSLESAGFYKKARSPETLPWGMFTHHQAMLYAKASIGTLRYDIGYQIAADYDFTGRFLKEAPRRLYIPAPLSLFESGGISQQKMGIGRSEQYSIRQSLDICSPAQNKIIHACQSFSAAIRKTMPRAYAMAKNQARRSA